MVPILAATTAVNAAGSVADGVISAWQALTASRSAAKPKDTGATSGTDSFSSMLSAHGVDASPLASKPQPTGSQPTAQQAHGGHHGGTSRVNQLA